MTDQVAVVTFTTPASPGTLPITDPSITESFSAAILIFTKETSDGTDNNYGMLGLGFIGAGGDDGTNTLQVYVTLQAQHGVASGQDMNTLRDNAGACLGVSTGDDVTPLSIVANYDSATAGGFVLNFTTTDAHAKCTAIIFAGLTNAVTGDCSFSDAGGSHEDTGDGVDFFEPDLVIFRSSDNVVNGNTANATLALGFATNTSPIQQVSGYVNWDELADPTDSDGFLRSDCCSGGFIGDRGVAMDRFQVTSFDSTGFNGIAIDTGGLNSPQANYLALKFSGQFSIGCLNAAISASTGNQDFTGFGFSPNLVLGMSTLMTSVDTLTDGATASAAGYFVTGDYGERAYTVHNEEGLNIGGAVVTDTHTRQEDVGLLTYEHGGTIAQRATWVGGISGGFRLSFSTATAGYMTVLGIGLAIPPVVTSETEQISDSVVAFLNRTLVFSETVQISDAVVLDTMDVSDTEGPAGWTYEARAERGTALTGGAEAGTVL